jgi:hypothetical protein
MPVGRDGVAVVVSRVTPCPCFDVEVAVSSRDKVRKRTSEGCAVVSSSVYVEMVRGDVVMVLAGVSVAVAVAVAVTVAVVAVDGKSINYAVSAGCRCRCVLVWLHFLSALSL